jgi:hypothetical protein
VELASCDVMVALSAQFEEPPVCAFRMVDSRVLKEHPVVAFDNIENGTNQ